MKRFFLVAAAVAAFSMIATPSARSQALFGPDLGLWVDAAKVTLGVVSEHPVTPAVSIQPGVHFVLGYSNTTFIVIDGNVHYNFALRGESFSPYVRAGLGLWWVNSSFGGGSSSTTDLKLNIGGGVTFNTRSTLQPFAGLSVAFMGGSDVKLHGGIKFAL